MHCLIYISNFQSSFISVRLIFVHIFNALKHNNLNNFHLWSAD